MPNTKPARLSAVEHKTFGAPIIDIPDDEPGTICAIVAVFNSIDSGADRILPGFFAKSLARKLPKGVWGHDWETPVAKTLEARELHPGDPALPESLKSLGGLYIKGQFNLDTQRGREAYSDIKFGAIDEFSFGYRATESTRDKKTGVRDLIEGDIFEWSPVLVGMNSRTHLISVKSRGGADPVAGKAFSSNSTEVVQTVGEFVRRAKARTQARVKAGRMLSQANIDSIGAVAAAIEDGCAALREILDRAGARPADEPAADYVGVDDMAKADSTTVESKPADVSPPVVVEHANPAVPVEAVNPAEEVVSDALVAAPDYSAAVLQEAIRFEAIRAASLGVPVGS